MGWDGEQEGEIIKTYTLETMTQSEEKIKKANEMERYTIFMGWTRRLNIEMPIFPKVIYKFNTKPVKMSSFLQKLKN